MADLDLGTIKATIDANTARYERAIKDMERLTRRVTTSIEKGSAQNQASFDKLGDTAKKAAKGVAILGVAGGALKGSAIVSAVSAAGGAINALGAGALQTAGAVQNLGGAIVGLPIVLTAAAGALGTVKLGLGGVGKAATEFANGDAEKFKAATKGMSAESIAFAKRLGGLKGVIEGFRASAAKGMIPGFNSFLSAGLQNVPLLNGFFRAMGESVGYVASRLADLTAKGSGFNGNFRQLLSQNVQTVHAFGDALHNVVSGFLNIMNSSGPMFDFINKGLAVNSERFDVWTRKVRNDKSFARFMADSVAALRSFSSTVGSSFTGLFTMLRTIQPYNAAFLGGLQKITGEFKQWSGSSAGQSALLQFMAESQPLLKAMVGLFGALGQSIFRIGVAAQKDMLPLVDSLRNKLLPAIEQIAIKTGPELLTGISNFAAAFLNAVNEIPRSITNVVNALAKVAEGIAFVVRNVAGVQELLFAWIAYTGVMKAVAVAQWLFNKALAATVANLGAARIAAMTTALTGMYATLGSLAIGAFTTGQAFKFLAADLLAFAAVLAPIAIAGGAIFLLVKGWQAYKAVQKEAKDELFSFNAAVSSNVFSTQIAGIKQYNADLQDMNGKLMAARKSLDETKNPLTFIQAAFRGYGAKKAIDENSEALFKQEKAAAITKTAIEQYAESQIKGTQAQMDFHNSQVLTGKAFADMAPLATAAGVQIGDTLETVTLKLDLYYVKTKNAATGTSEIKDAFIQLKKPLVDVDAEIKKVNAGLEQLFGRFVSASEADIAFRESLRSMTEAIKENGNTLNNNSEKADANRSAINASVTALNNRIGIDIKAGRVTDATAKKWEAGAKAILETAKSAGLSGPALEAYLKTLNMTPETKATLMKLMGVEAAKAEAGRVKASVESVPKVIPINFNVTTTGISRAMESFRAMERASASGGNATGGPIRRSAGGAVWGKGTATSDSIPALLSNGEYVIRAKAARKIGMGNLNRLNAFAGGGSVSAKDISAAKYRATASPLTKATDTFNASKKAVAASNPAIKAAQAIAKAAQVKMRAEIAQANAAEKALNAAKAHLQVLRDRVSAGGKVSKGEMLAANQAVRAAGVRYKKEDKERDDAIKKSNKANQGYNDALGARKDAYENFAAATASLADEVVAKQISDAQTAAQTQIDANNAATDAFVAASEVQIEGIEAAKAAISDQLGEAESGLAALKNRIQDFKNVFKTAALEGMSLANLFTKAIQTQTDAVGDLLKTENAFADATTNLTNLQKQQTEAATSYADALAILTTAQSRLGAVQDKVSYYLRTGLGSTEQIISAYEDLWSTQRQIRDSTEAANKAQADSNSIQDQVVTAMNGVTDAATAMAAAQVASAKATTGAVASILNDLKTRLTETKEFATTLGTLTGMGLSQSLIEQLAAMGPKAGLELANAILTAGPMGISELNSLTSQLDVAASTGLDAVAETFFGGAVAAMDAIIAGLKSKMAELDAQITAIQAAMAAVVSANAAANTALAASVATPAAALAPPTVTPGYQMDTGIGGPFKGAASAPNYSYTNSQLEYMGKRSIGVGTMSPTDVHRMAVGEGWRAGMRKFGGNVLGGASYLVGERGPEMYTPRTSGTISPNRDTMAMLTGSSGGGNRSTITVAQGAVQVSVSGDMNARDVEDAVTSAFRELLTQMKA